jgi:nicotinate-nucleotide pyrophosphorylase (carboxylating)
MVILFWYELCLMPQKKSKAKKSQKAGHLDRIGFAILPSWERALRTGLEDDGGLDWTTLGTLSRPDRPVRARVVAKSPGVWAADGLIAAMTRLAPEIRAVARVADGAVLRPGLLVCEWRGPADRILALERPFLNLAAFVGGIAHRTAGLVSRVRKACPTETPRVTATRKTLPGYRDLAICGVLAGGGHSHRVSLAGGVLIKENHIAAAGGILRAVEGVRRLAPHSLRLEIEVRDERELKQALLAGVDVVLLDNFTPADVQSALPLIAELGGSRAPLVEISGGLNEGNIADYAIPGVHLLSVGSLTHSVTAIDLSLLVEGA